MSERSMTVRTHLINLMQSFVDGRIDAATFERDYIRMWRQRRDADEEALLDPSVERVLDRAFTACDCFRPEDGGVRTAWDIDEKQFRLEISTFLQEVKKV